MLTDPPPRKATRAKFLESDRLPTLDLPENGNLVEIAHSIESAMVDGNAAGVRKSCSDLLTEMASFYDVPQCGIRVLASRPLRVRERWTSELFGDYSPDTIISTLRNSDFLIPGTREAFAKEPARSTTLLGELRPSVCSGRLPQAYAGVSIGPAPVAERETRRFVEFMCAR
jgi:hypothetical protein